MTKPFKSFFVGMGLVVLGVETAEAQPAKCLLEVNDRVYIDGSCEFRAISGGGGSFQITGPKGTYFAYLYVEGGGRATAHWNEEPGASHAHTPLGTLQRDGACWLSETVKLCAW